MRRRDFLCALAALSAGRLAVGEGRPVDAAAGLPPPATAAAGASGPAAELATESPVIFPPVLRGRELRFPEDHGAHPDFRIEWWYATGWLASAGGEPFESFESFGFQATFFRLRTGIGEHNPSAFAPRQLMLAHAAVSDPAHGRLRHAERAARVGFGRAGFVRGRTSVWVGDWRLDQDPDGNGYRAEVRGEDFAYSLRLAAAGAPLLNGDAGFSAKAADLRHASYYYSRPQLAVSGTLTRAGRRLAVSGRAWLDHEWSSALLPQAAQGWDWVGINLADGGALMAFRLRRPDGSPLWAAATLQAADGTAQALPPAAVAFEALRRWRSPRTGTVYPVEWRLRVGSRVLHLRPLIDDQELDGRGATGVVYWEGAVTVAEEGSGGGAAGPDVREVGRGYLELTGYGERLRFD